MLFSFFLQGVLILLQGKLIWTPLCFTSTDQNVREGILNILDVALKKGLPRN